MSDDVTVEVSEEEDVDITELGPPDEDFPPVEPDEDDVADGNHLGEVIDIDDDDDSGVDPE